MSANRIGRKPSRSSLPPPMCAGGSVATSAAGEDQEKGASVSSVAAAAASAAALLDSRPLSSFGCTCGAGDQLEQERLRLASHSRSVTERSECLAVREEEAAHLQSDCELRLETFLDAERAFAARRDEAARRRGEAEGALREVERQEAALADLEAALLEEEAQLQQLEVEAARGEADVADEELLLLEARGVVESELERLQLERAAQDAEASSLCRRLEDCRRAIDEAQRDMAALACDDALLAEIEAQLPALRRYSERRERALVAGEAHARAREADCEEREAWLVPEYHGCGQLLSSVEARERELRAREEEGERQRSELLQRQRDLGGAEIRLSGYEGALQQRRALAESGRLGSEAAAAPEEEPELRRRLSRLRAAEAGWAEKVLAQQASVQRLEARATELEAIVARSGSDSAAAAGRRRSSLKLGLCVDVDAAASAPRLDAP